MLQKNDLNKIMEYIAKGDPTQLLEEENLVKALNKLYKKGLVDITERKFSLTPAGEELKRKGENLMLPKVKVKHDFGEFSERNQKIGNLMFLISLIISLLSGIILLLLHQLS